MPHPCLETQAPLSVVMLASSHGQDAPPLPAAVRAGEEVLLCHNAEELRRALRSGSWSLVILERAAANAHPGLYEELLARPGGPSVALLTSEQLANLNGYHLRRRGLAGAGPEAGNRAKAGQVP
jgi:hypothetical protein